MKSVELKSSYAEHQDIRLSGGEQQRVAIARRLPYNLKMIIAVEPTENLDNQNKTETFQKLAHEKGKYIIIVTYSSNVCGVVNEICDLKNLK